MKIKQIIPLTICFLLVVAFCIPSALAVINPNFYRVNYIDNYVDNPPYYAGIEGYIQVKPSYYDTQNGHAQAGRLRFHTFNASGIEWFSDYYNTAIGTHEGDNRTLSRTVSHSFLYSDQIVFVELLGTFAWQPHTGDPSTVWPYPFGFGGETE